MKFKVGFIEEMNGEVKISFELPELKIMGAVYQSRYNPREGIPRAEILHALKTRLRYAQHATQLYNREKFISKLQAAIAACEFSKEEFFK